MKRKLCCSLCQMVFSHGELHGTFTGRMRFRLPKMALPSGSVFKQTNPGQAGMPQQPGTLLSSTREAPFAILFFCSASLFVLNEWFCLVILFIDTNWTARYTKWCSIPLCMAILIPRVSSTPVIQAYLYNMLTIPEAVQVRLGVSCMSAGVLLARNVLWLAEVWERFFSWPPGCQ